MSFQEGGKEIVDINYEQQQQEKEHLSSIESHRENSINNINSTSNFILGENRISPRNLDDLQNYQHTIKTMKEIRYNFIEEHKNIINTYFSIYSNRLIKYLRVI